MKKKQLWKYAASGALSVLLCLSAVMYAQAALDATAAGTAAAEASAEAATEAAAEASSEASSEAAAEAEDLGDEEMPFWAEDSLTAMSIKNYVEKVTDEESDSFIPVRDRIAVFDFDGTLYGELFPTYFDTTMFVHRVLHDDSWEAPEDLKQIAAEMEEGMKARKMPERSEEILATSIPRAYKGMTVSQYEDYVKEFMTYPVDGFEGMTYGEGYYLPMISLVKYLADHDFQIWICSGTDRVCVRTLVEHGLGWWIPPARVIGTNHTIVAAEQNGADPLNYLYKSGDDVVMGGELIAKNLKMNKVSAIVQEIGQVPVLTFGNSGSDLSMAQYTVNNEKYEGRAYLLLCDDTEKDYGSLKKALSLKETCVKSGFYTVSMKHDFTTIYGNDVHKIDHTDNYTWMLKEGEAQEAGAANAKAAKGGIATPGNYPEMGIDREHEQTTEIGDCETWTQMVDRSLQDGQGYANAELGGTDVFLVADRTFNGGAGVDAATEAEVFGYADGLPVYLGNVRCGGSATPLAIEDGKLYTAGHHYIGKHTVEDGALVTVEEAWQTFDADGNITYHYSSGGGEDTDLAEGEAEDLFESMLAEYFHAKPVAFSTVSR